LGRKTKLIHLSRKPNAIAEELWKNEGKDTLVMALTKVEEYMKDCLSKLEKKGYALSKIKLVNFEGSAGFAENLHLFQAFS
jgi:hypothetical protein